MIDSVDYTYIDPQGRGELKLRPSGLLMSQKDVALPLCDTIEAKVFGLVHRQPALTHFVFGYFEDFAETKAEADMRLKKMLPALDKLPPPCWRVELVQVADSDGELADIGTFFWLIGWQAAGEMRLIAEVFTRFDYLPVMKLTKTGDAWDMVMTDLQSLVPEPAN